MLNDVAMIVWVLSRSALRRATRHIVTDDRGEGVISAAIAVLIMAFLGAAMWIIFRQILDDAGSRTNSTINDIGAE